MNIEQMVRSREAVDLADNEPPDLTEAEAEARHLDEEINACRSQRMNCIMRAIRPVLAFVLLVIVVIILNAPLESLIQNFAAYLLGKGRSAEIDWALGVFICVAVMTLPVYAIVRCIITVVGITKQINTLEMQKRNIGAWTPRELRKREALRQAQESRKR